MGTGNTDAKAIISKSKNNRKKRLNFFIVNTLNDTMLRPRLWRSKN